MILTFVTLVILGLAAYRLTRIAVIDTIFEGFRAKIHVFLSNRIDKEGRFQIVPLKALDLISCTWCLGVWISLALYSIYALQYPWDFGRLGWINVLAIAGIQGMIHALEPDSD